MINLHATFGHYLHTDRKLDIGEVNEKVTGYGWTDNGRDLTGYYLLTEQYKLYYNLKQQYLYKEIIGM